MEQEIHRDARTSTYTDIGLEKCAQEKTPPINPVHTGTWNCPGYGNIRVQLMEFDLRILVFFQIGKELLPANGETVPGFNTLGSERLEWRLNQDKEPIAAITRFNTDDDSVLVIQKSVGQPRFVELAQCPQKARLTRMSRRARSLMTLRRSSAAAKIRPSNKIKPVKLLATCSARIRDN